jgi:hypothetical protein
MQTIAEIQLDTPGGVDRLTALRHKTKTYSAREYRADGASSSDVLVRVEGPHVPIKAWITSEPRSVASAMATLTNRRPLPASYVDYSTARVISEGATRDIMITHKVLVRVAEHSGRAVAQVEVGQDLDHHLAMLNQACSAAGITPIHRSRIDRIRDLLASNGSNASASTAT